MVCILPLWGVAPATAVNMPIAASILSRTCQNMRDLWASRPNRAWRDAELTGKRKSNSCETAALLPACAHTLGRLLPCLFSRLLLPPSFSPPPHCDSFSYLHNFPSLSTPLGSVFRTSFFHIEDITDCLEQRQVAHFSTHLSIVYLRADCAGAVVAVLMVQKV